MSKTWFNPHNATHCRAYRQYQKTGKWPKDLELLDMTLGQAFWELSIRGAIVQAWIDHKLSMDDYAQKINEYHKG